MKLIAQRRMGRRDWYQIRSLEEKVKRLEKLLCREREDRLAERVESERQLVFLGKEVERAYKERNREQIKREEAEIKAKHWEHEYGELRFVTMVKSKAILRAGLEDILRVKFAEIGAVKRTIKVADRDGFLLNKSIVAPLAQAGFPLFILEFLFKSRRYMVDAYGAAARDSK